MQRRSFLKLTARTAALAGVGDLGFLSQLRPVSAAEAKLEPKLVRLHPEIEPLVRLLEDTPRERVLEEIATRIHRGLTQVSCGAGRQLRASGEPFVAGFRSLAPNLLGD